MIIADKPWEKNNLGVNSREYIFDGKEEISEIEWDVLLDSKYDYKIVRIPEGRMDLSFEIQKRGYMLAETTIELECKLNELQMSKIQEKYCGFFSYNEASDEDIKLIYDYISQGIYDTDRISLDPYFGKEKSQRRIGNWLKSEIQTQKTKAYVVKMGDSEIGYFALKEISETELVSIQAGLFEKGSMGGFGLFVFSSLLEQAKKEGKKKVSTAVSSNNLISVKTHLGAGFKLTGFKYVFVKHN